MDLIILNILGATKGFFSIIGLASAGAAVQLTVLAVIAVAVTVVSLLLVYAIGVGISRLISKKNNAEKIQNKASGPDEEIGPSDSANDSELSEEEPVQAPSVEVESEVVLPQIKGVQDNPIDTALAQELAINTNPMLSGDFNKLFQQLKDFERDISIIRGRLETQRIPQIQSFFRWAKALSQKPLDIQYAVLGLKKIESHVAQMVALRKEVDRKKKGIEIIIRVQKQAIENLENQPVIRTQRVAEYAQMAAALAGLEQKLGIIDKYIASLSTLCGKSQELVRTAYGQAALEAAVPPAVAINIAVPQEQEDEGDAVVPPGEQEDEGDEIVPSGEQEKSEGEDSKPTPKKKQ